MTFIDKTLAEPALNFYAIDFTEKDFTNCYGAHYASRIIDFPVVYTPKKDGYQFQGDAVFLFDGIPQRYTVLDCKLRPDGKYLLSIVI